METERNPLCLYSFITTTADAPSLSQMAEVGRHQGGAIYRAGRQFIEDGVYFSSDLCSH